MINKKLKGISFICIIFVVFLLIYNNSFASNISIDSNKLKLLQDKGYVLSDGYSDVSNCDNKRNEYNNIYNKYERTSCFINENKYYYLICDTGFTCDLNGLGVDNSNITSISTNINKDSIHPDIIKKLDTILISFKDKKKQLSKLEFQKLYNDFNNKLNQLKIKYSTNTNVNNIINYLISELEIINNDKSDEVSNFMCELLGNCSSSSTNNSTGTTNNTTDSNSNKILLFVNNHIKYSTEGEYEAYTFIEGSKAKIVSSNTLGTDIVYITTPKGEIQNGTVNQKVIEWPDVFLYDASTKKVTFTHPAIDKLGWNGAIVGIGNSKKIKTYIETKKLDNTNTGSTFVPIPVKKDCGSDNFSISYTRIPGLSSFDFKPSNTKNATTTVLNSTNNTGYAGRFSCDNGTYKLTCPPNSFAPCIPSLYKTDNQTSNTYTPNYLYRTFNVNNGKHYIKSSTSKDKSSIITHPGETVEGSAILSKENIDGTKAIYYTSGGPEGYLTYNPLWSGGIAGYGWQNSNDGRIAIYNCIVGGNDYFLSTESNCEGQKRVDGEIFYMYPNDINGNSNNSTNTQSYPELFEKDINYKGNLKLNIKMPKRSSKVPVYLDVHGGGWAMGSKDINFLPENKKFPDSIVNSGIGFVSINYTLSTSSVIGSDYVYKDIDCALQWLEKNKDKYQIDTDNIYIGGGSAGGHLSMQYALKQSSYKDTSCENNSKTPIIKKVVPVSGGFNLAVDGLPVAGSTSILTNVNELVNNFIGIYNTEERISSQKTIENSPLYSLGSSESKNKKYFIVTAYNDNVLDYKVHSIAMYEKMISQGYDVILDDTGDQKHGGYEGVGVIDKIVQFLKGNYSSTSYKVDKSVNNGSTCMLPKQFCPGNNSSKITGEAYLNGVNNITIIARGKLPKENISFCLTTGACSKLDQSWKPLYVFGISTISGYQTTLTGVPAGKYEGYFKYIDENNVEGKSNNMLVEVKGFASGNVTVNSHTPSVTFTVSEGTNPKFYFNVNGGAFSAIDSGWKTTKSNGMVTYTQDFQYSLPGVYNSYVTYGNDKLTLNPITVDVYFSGNASVNGNTATVTYTVSNGQVPSFYFNHNGGTFTHVPTGWTTSKLGGTTTYTQNFPNLPSGVYNSYIMYGNKKYDLNQVTIN